METTGAVKVHSIVFSIVLKPAYSFLRCIQCQHGCVAFIPGMCLGIRCCGQRQERIHLWHLWLLDTIVQAAACCQTRQSPHNDSSCTCADDFGAAGVSLLARHCTIPWKP